MKIRREDIDVEKFIQLEKERDKIDSQIKAYNKQYEQISKQMLNLFPKGYWWSYDIDKDWKYPKKYSIKSVSRWHKEDEFFITVKEVFKKKPWPGFTGEHHFRFKKFSEINIYKTEEEAKQMYPQRICPQCGGLMGFSRDRWCYQCEIKRQNQIKEFEKKHRFYCPADGNVYQVNYEDEFTPKIGRGFYGKHFVIKRIDTEEIIHTNDLCSHGPFEKNKESLPHIEFLDEYFS